MASKVRPDRYSIHRSPYTADSGSRPGVSEVHTTSAKSRRSTPAAGTRMEKRVLGGTTQDMERPAPPRLTLKRLPNLDVRVLPSHACVIWT